MASMKYLAYRAAFEALWATQAAGLIRNLSRCRGVIFTLHRVLPDAPADFSPNAILQVTPDYLEFVIIRMRELGIDLVSLDEAARRITAAEPSPPFAALTFDDAYRDNLRHALPILRRRKCPFALYVPTALVDGVGEVWWQALEDIIAGQNVLAVPGETGELDYLETGSPAKKQAAYYALYARMRTMPEHDRVSFIHELAKRYGLNLHEHCRELIMDWSELAAFVKEPLCTIGAHTVHHYELAKLEASEARQEIAGSVDVIRAQFDLAPQHLSYPIGGRTSAADREFAMAAEMGFRTAVTTRPGGLYQAHKDALTALPRISLNGNFQDRRFVDIMATGAVFTAAGRLLG